MGEGVVEVYSNLEAWRLERMGKWASEFLPFWMELMPPEFDGNITHCTFWHGRGWFLYPSAVIYRGDKDVSKEVGIAGTLTSMREFAFRDSHFKKMVLPYYLLTFIHNQGY